MWLGALQGFVPNKEINSLVLERPASSKTARKSRSAGVPWCGCSSNLLAYWLHVLPAPIYQNITTLRLSWPLFFTSRRQQRLLHFVFKCHL